MLRNRIALAALSLCGLVAFGSSAKAQDMLGGPTANPWELTLGGSASHGPDLNGFNAAANVSVGYYFGNLELVGRQSLSYTDVGITGSGKGSALNASTDVALDLHFPLGDHGEWVPYIGVNLGYIYGDAVHDTWEAGPEAGLKYYVNSNTFVFASVQYEFFFDKNTDAGEAFSDGEFVYGLGIGFRF